MTPETGLAAIHAGMGKLIAAIGGYRAEDLVHVHVSERRNEQASKLLALSEEMFDLFDPMTVEGPIGGLNAHDFNYELQVSDALHGRAA